MPKNGFNVPGTSFEAIFASPTHGLGHGNLQDPIYLSDVSAKDFRAFLKFSYPLYVRNQVIEERV